MYCAQKWHLEWKLRNGHARNKHPTSFLSFQATKCANYNLQILLSCAMKK
uniref:Uncharacterized protein n=1 Tax=Rhizophora mucronata TaxID=61149 RepID=A0A2P2QDU2_RHIMU